MSGPSTGNDPPKSCQVRLWFVSRHRKSQKVHRLALGFPLLVGGLGHQFGIFPLILGCSSSQLTNSIIFQRGKPTTNQFSFFFLPLKDHHTRVPPWPGFDHKAWPVPALCFAKAAGADGDLEKRKSWGTGWCPQVKVGLIWFNLVHKSH